MVRKSVTLNRNFNLSSSGQEDFCFSLGTLTTRLQWFQLLCKECEINSKLPWPLIEL